MARVYEITYLRTGKTETFYCADGLFYKVGDNAYIRLRAQIAWCPNCGQFVDAETIDSIEDTENELKQSIEQDRNRLKNFDNMPPERFTEKKKRSRDYYSRTLAEAERTIEWRRNRESAERCLTCASTSITVPRENESLFVPGKGKVEVGMAPIFADVEYMMWVFSPEGIRMPDEQKE